jgi:hypothetical protein
MIITSMTGSGGSVLGTHSSLVVVLRITNISSSFIASLYGRHAEPLGGHAAQIKGVLAGIIIVIFVLGCFAVVVAALGIAHDNKFVTTSHAVN